jgi:hypothetical protein
MPLATLLTLPFGSATIPTLNNLTLNTSSIAENSAAAAVVGTIQNKSASSVLSLTNDGGGRFALSGNDVVRTATALNYETTPSVDIVVRETLAGASNTPHDNTITITVTNVLETTLAALGGTFTLAESASSGAVAGALTGVTSGSTLSLVDDAGGRVALSGSNIVRGATALDYETATSHSFTVRETHADGSNSPRDTVFSLTVTDVADGAPVNTVAPVISGTPQIGQTITLTNDGTWDVARTFTGRYWFSSPNAIVGESETSETQLDPSSLTSYDADATLEGQYIACLVVGCNAFGCNAAWSNVLGPIIDAADVTPPTLSLPTGASSGMSTADIGVTTNEGNGILYWVVTTSATTPSAAQIKAGQDHASAAAPDSGSQAVGSTGVKTDSASGLTASTNYYAHFMHEDASTNQSNRVSSTVFTTSAVGSLSAPVLTATTTTENPPAWESAHDGDIEIWDGVDTGDKWRLVWRLGGAGAWTTEVYQGVDDELFTGGFVWPLWEAAQPFAAGQIEVKEQRSRWVSGVKTHESSESNTLSFTVVAPAAPWNPTSDGALSWYDASDLTTLFTDTAGTTAVTTDAQAVARWNDKGSNADHALQATSGDRPTYRTASNVNGLPGLRVNGGVNVNAGMDIANTWSVLVDMLPNAHIDSVQAMNATTTANIALGSDCLIVLQVASNGGGAGAGTAKWYLNGTQVGSTTTGLTVASDRLFGVTLDLLTAGNFSAGRIIASQRLFNRNTDGRAADGDFRSIVLFGTQSDALRQKLEGYLAYHDGFTLPSGHPYETDPPTV